MPQCTGQSMSITCCLTSFFQHWCLWASTKRWAWKTRQLPVSPASWTPHNCLNAWLLLLLTSQAPCSRPRILLRLPLPCSASVMRSVRSPQPKFSAQASTILGPQVWFPNENCQPDPQRTPHPLNTALLLLPSLVNLVQPVSHLLKSHAPALGSLKLLAKVLVLPPLPIHPPRNQSQNWIWIGRWGVALNVVWKCTYAATPGIWKPTRRRTGLSVICAAKVSHDWTTSPGTEMSVVAGGTVQPVIQRID